MTPRTRAQALLAIEDSVPSDVHAALTACVRICALVTSHRQFGDVPEELRQHWAELVPEFDAALERLAKTVAA